MKCKEGSVWQFKRPALAVTVRGKIHTEPPPLRIITKEGLGGVPVWLIKCWNEGHTVCAVSRLEGGRRCSRYKQGPPWRLQGFREQSRTGRVSREGGGVFQLKANSLSSGSEAWIWQLRFDGGGGERRQAFFAESDGCNSYPEGMRTACLTRRVSVFSSVTGDRRCIALRNIESWRRGSSGFTVLRRLTCDECC